METTQSTWGKEEGCEGPFPWISFTSHQQGRASGIPTEADLHRHCPPHLHQLLHIPVFQICSQLSHGDERAAANRSREGNYNPGDSPESTAQQETSYDPGCNNEGARCQGPG